MHERRNVTANRQILRRYFFSKFENKNDDFETKNMQIHTFDLKIYKKGMHKKHLKK